MEGEDKFYELLLMFNLLLFTGGCFILFNTIKWMNNKEDMLSV